MIEQASLVIGEGNWAVKSDSLLGYKINGGKYYPREMSVVRATTGTRINEDGLVELVPYNLLSWSEDFSTTRGFGANVVGGSTAVFTANYATAPNGTMTADRIQLALNGQPYADWVQVLSLPLVTGSTYTYSIYLKSLSGSDSLMIFNDGVDNITKTITTDWQRYDYTWTATTGSVYPRFLLQAGTSTSADLVAWGYQINEGSSALDYLPTTDRLDVARIDYSSGSGALLVEPQRTNLQTYSEQHNVGPWNQLNLSITANNSIAPNGTNTADLVYASTGVVNVQNYNSQTRFSLTVGASYTQSVFLKSAGFTWAIVDNMNGSAGAWFNLATGTIGTVVSGSTAKIEDFGNGWYRCSVTSSPSGTTGYGDYRLANADNDDSVTANGTNGILAWGFQVELGSYATSYIPTQAATVTRNADLISKTGIADLIGQTEGTLYLDFVWTKVGKTYQSILLGGTSNYGNSVYLLTAESSGNVWFSLYIGGTTFISQITTTFTNGTRYKVALTYKSGSIAFYVNGVSVGTSSATYGTVSESISQLLYYWPYGGDEQWCSPINTTAIFKTRLTNAELASLTSI